MATSKTTEDRRRPERVASRVREEITAALNRDLSDPRLAGVVVSDVQVTDDLSLADVSIVVMGDDEAMSRAEGARKVLAKLEGGLRKRLAPRLGMRRVPSLRFRTDHGRAEVERLDSILHEVSEELKKKGE
jgi:ribosome-binding factor A